MPQHAIPVHISQTDESLPAEIKEIIRDINVESVVFRDKPDYVNENYTISYKNLMKTRYSFAMNFYCQLFMYKFSPN